MVVDTQGATRADRVFHALADPTRRDIVRRCMIGGHSVSDLARSYPMSFAAVQKHVATLHAAGLVSKERRGRERIVRTEVAAIHHAQHLLDGLEELWRARMECFGGILAESGEGADT
jgi:DNA-binding transcriptional ArsR family regulator